MLTTIAGTRLGETGCCRFRGMTETGGTGHGPVAEPQSRGKAKQGMARRGRAKKDKTTQGRAKKDKTRAKKGKQGR